MHHDVSLPFKNFVPHLVSCLEDPDGAVRDAAKGAIADLFWYECLVLYRHIQLRMLTSFQQCARQGEGGP